MKKRAKRKKPKGPLWKGPEEDGITYSLLCRFLGCRERFRLRVVEGLRPAPRFNHRIEYGNMWHVCEEELAKESESAARGDILKEYLTGWQQVLQAYAKGLCRQYPLQQEQVQHWYRVCKVAFPVYVDYWSKHPDVKNRTPLLQEQTFNVPYTLPSGRVVRLRGKWDSVDLIGLPKSKMAGVYLQENKTKGDIKEEQLKGQLASGFEFQTMIYLTALEQAAKKGYLPCNAVYDETKGSPGRMDWGGPLRGIRYNAVRRPLSGGKGSIRQRKPTKGSPAGESDDEFYTRLGGIIQEDPGSFFMRWKVEVSPSHIARFRRECLDPILEQLCNWWLEVTGQHAEASLYKAKTPLHFRTPYGVYDILKEGGNDELDEYLNTGSELGLIRTDNLFPELE